MKKNIIKRVLLPAVAVAIIIAAIAAIPAIAFKIEDENLYKQSYSYPQVSGNLTGLINGESGYDIIDSLMNISNILNENPEEYYYKEICYQSKDFKSELLIRVIEYLESLSLYGLISEETKEYIVFNILPRDEVNFTYGMDSLGNEDITCNFGMGIYPPYYIYFKVDGSTGLLLRVSASLPPEVPIHNDADIHTVIKQLQDYYGISEIDDLIETNYALIEEYVSPETYFYEFVSDTYNVYLSFSSNINRDSYFYQVSIGLIL